MRTPYEDRFEVVSREGSEMRNAGVRMILRDRETGVNYLVWRSGYGGGITPLLNADGKPIVTAGANSQPNDPTAIPFGRNDRNGRTGDTS